MPAMSDDDFHIVGDFADIEDVDWDTILPFETVTSTTVHSSASHSGSSSPSKYFDDSPVDSSFLEALDAVERELNIQSGTGPSHLRYQVLGHSPRGGSTSNRVVNPGNETLIPETSGVERRTSGEACSSCSMRLAQGSSGGLKRSRSSKPGSPVPALKKGKWKDEEIPPFQRLLEEFSCPMQVKFNFLYTSLNFGLIARCFDIVVASHTAVPCGHGFCGPCGYEWIFHAKKKTCPSCRTYLSEDTKMVPNFMLDNFVEKILEHYGKIAEPGWARGGKLHLEWTKRREEWKATTRNSVN
ncbi:hypothetical protein FA15DRAFT_140277 [Coprinopsis marcescibilis]|uniref:RING-type domain-containing protein n=1 Tax=Coprinopsis marcescibilis TaxID=230819 RepID=A0A5C3KJV7_COPMA|nr:hypothetical protein FA15DRAFT_140277 [Coprinopsis marcescibilis]